MENLAKKERLFSSFVLIKNVKELVGGWLVVRAELLSELLLFSFSIFSLHLQTDASLFFPSALIRKRSQDAKCEKRDRKKRTEKDTLWMPTFSSSSSLLLSVLRLFFFLFFSSSCCMVIFYVLSFSNR